jgi:light-regulated signal transduction histidine kinase (bacteriophytochrome)
MRTQTPRTDEVRHNVGELAMFARQLERELNEANAKLAQVHKDLGHELRDPNGTIWEECARLQKRVKELEGL